MADYRQATFDRTSLKRRSIRSKGQHAAWVPTGVEHSVDADLGIDERVTLCGLPATGIHIWSKPFAHTLFGMRCVTCDEVTNTSRPAADRS